MVPVLLATCADLPDGDEDAGVLVRALAERGVDARWAAWTDPQSTGTTALVVLRSTWDYTNRPRRTSSTGSRACDAGGQRRGRRRVEHRQGLPARPARGRACPTVPTCFAAPGRGRSSSRTRPRWSSSPRSGPARAASAGSPPTAPRRRWEHAAALHAAGRTVLVQPYLEAVDTAGETALVYFDGRFSHAVRKGPMLPAGITHPVDGRELYVEERITARTPAPDELEVGAAALQAVRDRFGGRPALRPRRPAAHGRRARASSSSSSPSRRCSCTFGARTTRPASSPRRSRPAHDATTRSQRRRSRRCRSSGCARCGG